MSALLMTIASVTGAALLFYIERKSLPGLRTAFAGVALLLAAYWFGRAVIASQRFDSRVFVC